MRGKIALAIVLVCAYAIVAGGLSYRSITRLEGASDWTDHTFLVLIALGELEAQLDRLETNQRGFLLTGDARYLDPNESLERTIAGNLESLATSVSDNPVQRPNIALLRKLVPQRMEVMRQTRETYFRQGQPVVLTQLRAGNSGNALMGNIHGVLDNMAGEEKRLLTLRRAEEERQRQENDRIIVASAAATLLFLGFIAFLIRDDLAVRNRLQEAVEHLALRDSLTGLSNSAAFAEGLETALARARRFRRSLAVLLFDLDGFKAINDRYGQLAGDQVLYQAANRVREILRASDTFARLEGDRFIVLADEIAARDNAVIAATKIIDTLSRPFEFQGGSCQISASVGISLFPDDDTRAAQLIQFAEEAMLKAKQAGKARFRFFHRRDGAS